MLGVAPDHKDRERVRLPPSLHALYYVIRPLRMALKGIVAKPRLMNGR
jgi:hypothetical protein